MKEQRRYHLAVLEDYADSAERSHVGPDLGPAALRIAEELYASGGRKAMRELLDQVCSCRGFGKLNDWWTRLADDWDAHPDLAPKSRPTDSSRRD